jgi:hypothetical protein
MEVQWSIPDRIKMVEKYVETHNYHEVSRSFPLSHRPSPSTVSRLLEKWHMEGSVQDRFSEGRPRTVLCEDKKLEIFENVLSSPQNSLRKREKDLHISKSSIWRSLVEDDFYAYHPTLLEVLTGKQKSDRVAMCTELLKEYEDDEDFFSNIWFSDECMFGLDREVNKHNCVYWSVDNPHFSLPVTHTKKKVHCWCALSSHGIIGPYFFDGIVTAEKYVDMLDSFFLPTLFSHSYGVYSYFQQDGAAPHTCAMTAAFLNWQLPYRWIGAGGKWNWAAKSPDLTPPDFFLWGHLKSQVYRYEPKTLDELEDAITESIRDILVEMCQNVSKSVRKRMQLCCDLNGEIVHGR